MIELRKNPRANVSWRAAIKLGEGKIVPAKVMNISQEGILIHCPFNVELHKEYQLMMEVPHINPSVSERYQVPGKVLVMHSILSGDFYRIGLRFIELSDLHRNLLAAWTSKANKGEHATSGN